MDLQTITDIQQLKAMAYDQLVSKEIAENNIRAISQRLSELEQQPPKTKDDEAKKRSND